MRFSNRGLHRIFFHLLVIGVIFLIGIAPIVSTALGLGAAEMFECKIGMDRPRPCVVGDVDIAPILLMMIFFGWVGAVTVPIAFALITLYVTGVVAVTMIKWYRNK
jgi:hypothetical protein